MGSPLLSASVLAALACGGIALGVCVWSILTRRQAVRERRDLGERLSRAESQAKEQARQLARIRTEQGTIATLSLALPNVVRDLNRSDLTPREVPRLILRLAEAIFQPSQVLLYLVRLEDREPQLVLAEQRGLSDVPTSIRTIRIGQGKIGWIAENKVDMTADDWLNPARTEGETVEDNHPGLALDIAGPLIHLGGHREEHQVLGVLCIGSPANHPRDEKLMFQMVSNLGSLALVNVHNMSRFREQANHDGLTSLWTKKYFRQRLSEHIAQCGSERVALFIFDIDHFKNYNDTNGHPAGDDLLRQLAKLLRQNLRESDWSCRYGGEEFMVAMLRTDESEAVQAAERIRRAIEQFPFPHEHKQPGGELTISGGVAVLPYDGNSVDGLIEKADLALYQSKQNGRNRVTRYRGVDIGSYHDDDETQALDGEPELIRES